MDYIITGIITVLFFTTIGLIFLTHYVFKHIDILESIIVNLRFQIEALTEENKTLLTSEDIISGFKQAYNNGLISKEVYKDNIEKLLNTDK